MTLENWAHVSRIAHRDVGTDSKTSVTIDWGQKRPKIDPSSICDTMKNHFLSGDKDFTIEYKEKFKKDFFEKLEK